MIVTTIPVTDLDRAKHFYAEALGLKVLWESPASVRFGCGGGTELSIFRRTSSTADHTLAHFEVADIETVVGELEIRLCLDRRHVACDASPSGGRQFMPGGCVTPGAGSIIDRRLARERIMR